ncbi:hypothetical protein [Pseudomonas sp. NBRC 100443]|uniref:hypothetical protein n=1 Tax=Pseudomonas sp. NBRC 100443 TaxID=1113665 RepID=UPI0024A3BD79|nr:hypothetical protein [Pseudomonas sp. NBRC 100443]GLU39494.1 hypothetical protein Pssp01_35870 [Pseudomonas sp. NBRC 100443]
MSSYAVSFSAFTDGDGRKLLWAVFLGSLILSLVASLCNPILARDAALYLDIAAHYREDGFSESFERFDWPWFPMLLGLLHWISGLDLELIGRLLCELFTAIACVACVDIVRRTRVELLSWAALAVLAVPAFNAYRGDILRENGFWCFAMLGLWCMHRWMVSRRLSLLLLGFVAVLVATLFRFEAMYLVLVVPVVAVLRVHGGPLKRSVAIVLGGVGVLAVCMGLVWARRHGWLPQGRIDEYVAHLELPSLLAGLHQFASRLAESMPFEYAREDAALILLMGLFGYLLLKVFSSLGVMVVPWLYGAIERRRNRDRDWLLLDVAAAGYLVILLLFLIDHLFLSARYVAFLGFLLVPVMAMGLHGLAVLWPRLRPWLVGGVLLLALANVVSFSAPKTHLRDAGLWLGSHLSREARVYQEDNRLGYFAGWGYGSEGRDREQALALKGHDAYEYFALDLKREPEAQLAQLKAKGLEPLAEFHNRRGETYVIFRRAKVP